MYSIWSQLEMQLQQYVPDIRKHLRSGALESTIQWVEEWLPVVLPEEVKAFYRIHDGQSEDSYIVDGWSFFSLKRLCFIWLYEMRDFGLPGSYNNFVFPCSVSNRYPAYWHPHWLPFMGHLKGPVYCIDLAPGPRGNVGQILFHNIRHTYYYDSIEPAPSIRVIAPNIQIFMEMLVNDLNAEKYVLEQATELLVSKNISPELLESIVTYKKRKQGQTQFFIDFDLTWEYLSEEYLRGFYDMVDNLDEYLLFEERIVHEEYPNWSFPMWQPRPVSGLRKSPREVKKRSQSSRMNKRK